jgi:hypothetical protein
MTGISNIFIIIIAADLISLNRRKKREKREEEHIFTQKTTHTHHCPYRK